MKKTKTKTIRLQSGPVDAEVTMKDLRALVIAVQVGISKLLGIPPEDAVPGWAVAEFHAHWPEGYYWEDEALWGEEYEDDPIDPERLYDMTGWEVSHEDNQFNPEELYVLFKDYWEKRQERTGQDKMPREPPEELQQLTVLPLRRP